MRAIFLVLTKLNIQILMSHVPGADNVWMDALSRMDTAGDYEVLPDVFRDGARALGSNATIDLFASRYNHKRAPCSAAREISRRSSCGGRADVQLEGSDPLRVPTSAKGSKSVTKARARRGSVSPSRSTGVAVATLIEPVTEPPSRSAGPGRLKPDLAEGPLAYCRAHASAGPLPYGEAAFRLV
jgi:hypothetical protein